MAQRLNPAARDAAVSRIAMITTGVVALGLAGTVGLGVAIAAETPVKKKATVTNQVAPAPGGPAAGAPVVPVPNPQGKVTPPAKGQATPPKGQVTPKAPAPAPKPQVTQQAPDTTSGGS